MLSIVVWFCFVVRFVCCVAFGCVVLGCVVLSYISLRYVALRCVAQHVVDVL